MIGTRVLKRFTSFSPLSSRYCLNSGVNSACYIIDKHNNIIIIDLNAAPVQPARFNYGVLKLGLITHNMYMYMHRPRDCFLLSTHLVNPENWIEVSFLITNTLDYIQKSESQTEFNC